MEKINDINQPIRITTEQPKGKACAYLRESIEDKNKTDTSMDNQFTICERKAKEMRYKIIEIFRDDNKSGATLFRKGIQKLIQRANEKPEWDVLLIKDQSRLSRSNLDQEILFRDLSALGVKIISCDGSTDSKEARQVIGLSNEWYIDKCRRDTTQLHNIKLAENIPLNRPPFGLKIPLASRKNINGRSNPSYDPSIEKKFIPSPIALKKVIKMFEMKRDGASIKDICKEFKMNFQTVQHILSNKTYMGCNCYKGIWKKGRHDAVIPMDLWESVNGELKIEEQNVSD